VLSGLAGLSGETGKGQPGGRGTGTRGDGGKGGRTAVSAPGKRSWSRGARRPESQLTDSMASSYKKWTLCEDCWKKGVDDRGGAEVPSESATETGALPPAVDAGGLQG